MAYTGADVVGIKVTTVSATTAYHDISQYIQDFSGLKTEAFLHESHAFGDAWKEQKFSGFSMADDITLSGFYEDTAATGPHAIFGTLSMLGAERNIKLNWGTTNAYNKVDVIIRSYSRIPTRGELTKFEVVLAPTGAVTLVTT